MKKLLAVALALALAPSFASAQTYTNRALIVGAGAGVKGFKTAGPCTNAQVISWPSGVSGDPACGALPASIAITLANGQLFIGNVSNVATAVALSQDCTVANTGVITCTKTNNVAFAASATTDTTSATNISSGTLANGRYAAVNLAAGNVNGGVTGVAPIANGGTNGATQQAALNNISPTPTRAGDMVYYNGSNWVAFAGNNSGTKILTQDGSGVPAWAASGSVSSVTCGTGMTGGTITTTGTCAVSLTAYTNSLSGDVTMGSSSTYYDGPSVAQGTSGTWFASGAVSLNDSSGGANSFSCKLWDGTTVIASANTRVIVAGTGQNSMALSGYLASPANNIKISCSSGSTTGSMKFNTSGTSKDSTLSAFRIQ